MNINYNNFSRTTKFNDGDIPYITARNLEATGIVSHAFSTRIGGVSTGIYSSMNLTFTREDNPVNVSRNFELFAGATGVKTEDMVYSMQTHTTNVMEVTEAHRGMGVVKERDFSDIDGLVTNVPGITLVTSYADCVPLYIVDPIKHAIGLSHSGWRGTVNNIAAVTVNKMTKLYGTNPKDLVVFIGPSICRDCYEVSADVAEEFATVYGSSVFDKILHVKNNGKFKLDLWQANFTNFVNCGVNHENIAITDICTCCNSELLFSHRASKGMRGGLCGFLTLQR